MPLRKIDPRSWEAQGINQDRMDNLLESRTPVLTLNVPEDALHDLILKGYNISDDDEPSKTSGKTSFMRRFWTWALSPR